MVKISGPLNIGSHAVSGPAVPEQLTLSQDMLAIWQQLQVMQSHSTAVSNLALKVHLAITNSSSPPVTHQHGSQLSQVLPLLANLLGQLCLPTSHNLVHRSFSARPTCDHRGIEGPVSSLPFRNKRALPRCFWKAGMPREGPVQHPFHERPEE